MADPGNNWLADNMDTKAGLNQECVAAYEKNNSDWRVCQKGAAALRYIKTPTFVLNSLYNWCPAYFAMNLLKKKTGILKTMLKKYREVVIDAMQPAWDPHTPHGVFSDACRVHVESSVSWNSVQLNGTLMRESAARWYFEHSVEKLLDSHSLHLNVSNVNGTEEAVGFWSDNPTC